MKKLTLGSLAIVAVAMIGPAQAADMPVKAAPLVAPAWSWTGFYWGGNIGYSWGRAQSSLDGTLGSKCLERPVPARF